MPDVRVIFKALAQCAEALPEVARYVCVPEEIMAVWAQRYAALHVR